MIMAEVPSAQRGRANEKKMSAPGRLEQSAAHRPPPLSHAPSQRPATDLRRPFLLQLLPLRHLFLLSALLAYQFVGAVLFVLCEAEAEQQREREWTANWTLRRAQLARRVREEWTAGLAAGGNGSEGHHWMETLENALLNELVAHENSLLAGSGASRQSPRMRWDLWNAMLYAQSIFTTIGYGHLFAITLPGRVLTMLYALVGIPFVLTILDDLGKLLSGLLKLPWFLFKCVCRRAFRHCTRQSHARIRALDRDDRRELGTAELPLPLAVLALFGWICLCAFTLCLWERQWDFFTALYFVFISLSTIGLGDITPSSRPVHLLLLSVFLIIGLSLVSMTVGLLQSKLYRLRDRYCSSSNAEGVARNISRSGRRISNPLLRRNPKGSSLGILSTNTSSSRASLVRGKMREKRWQNKCTQTLLSFPSPAIGNSRVARTITQNGLKLIPRSLSIDDVMRLVDTEEGDILLLTELTLSRDETGLSAETTTEGMVANGMASSSSSMDSSSVRVWSSEEESSTTLTSSSSTNNSGELHHLNNNGGRARRGTGRWDGDENRGIGTSGNAVVLSRSFDHHFPTPPQPQFPMLAPHIIPPLSAHQLFSSILGGLPNDMTDLELLEELEDRMALAHGSVNMLEVMPSARTLLGLATAAEGLMMPSGSSSTTVGGVHFRSRLSLIPEQRSIDEEMEGTAGTSTIHSSQMSILMGQLEEQEKVPKMPQTEERNVEEGKGGSKERNEKLQKGSWSSGSLSALLKGGWRRANRNGVDRQQQQQQK